MRFFIQVSCLLAFATVASCNDLVKEKLVGNWKEDQYKRTGLNDFLYEMGMNWIKRAYVTSASWENEQYITFEEAANKFHVEGIKGPREDPFNFDLMVDEAKTQTPVELGELGGSTMAEAHFEGNSLVTHIHNKETGEHFLTATRTVYPDEPNHMTYTTYHVPSETAMVSQFYRKEE